MPAAKLYLLIQLGRDRYAIDSSLVEEVVSLVRLKALPGAPNGVAGLMNYRAAAVPVIDLSLLAFGTATPQRVAARIVVVRHPDTTEPGSSALLGLMVPMATETRRIDDEAFVEPTVASDGAPYLGQVLATPEGIIQRVSVDALLTDELRDVLARGASAA